MGSPCSPRDSQSLLQHHSSKASVLLCSVFFIVQLSHPYMTTGKTIALTRWIFVGKGISLVFKMSLLHSGHHRALSRVPCALQYVLISYLFYI